MAESQGADLMIVRDHGDGGRWYVVARSYPTAFMAERAWELLERKINLALGDQGVGIVRLGPRPEGGAIETGDPGPGHLVVGVTLHEATADKMERLAGGQGFDPLPDFADAVIARRCRVVTSQPEGMTGRIKIRRPHGADLDALGNLYERPGGQG